MEFFPLCPFRTLCRIPIFEEPPVMCMHLRLRRYYLTQRLMKTGLPSRDHFKLTVSLHLLWTSLISPIQMISRCVWQMVVQGFPYHTNEFQCSFDDYGKVLVEKAAPGTSGPIMCTLRTRAL